jgi:hypothetical protein
MEEGEYYKSIQKVYCPYFKEYIHFTDVGFNHLRFKNHHTARSIKDRNMRFSLLSAAVKIIADSHTLQGKKQKLRMEERYVNNRKETALMLVTYYEFIAIIRERKVTVIIKQIVGWDKVFLSVIPTFKQKTPSEDDDSL